jgi:hypothetical protein
MSIRQKILNVLFPHRGMTEVMVHDECGGWLAFIEYNCGYQLKCTKCGQAEEAYWGMGQRLMWHYEWFPTERVNKFYDD